MVVKTDNAAGRVTSMSVLLSYFQLGLWPKRSSVLQERLFLFSGGVENGGVVGGRCSLRSSSVFRLTVLRIAVAAANMVFLLG